MTAAPWRRAGVIDLGRRVCDVVLRPHLPDCDGSAPYHAGESYCEACGVFRCPRCRLFRRFDDGGGDDPHCNECWCELRDHRIRSARRLWQSLRARRITRLTSTFALA